jgi:dTDP-glucose 4,6-dehydratase
MNDSKRTILVTGGAGFIGSTFVRRWLAEESAAVVNLDKLTYAGHRASLEGVLDDPRHTLVEGDVNDAPLLEALLDEHRPWAIVHLAAETHVDRSIESPAPFAVTNVQGTCTLLDAATRYWQAASAAEREAFRFLYVSTDEVFGSAQAGATFDEQSALSPNSPYAASKAAGEHFVRAFANTYGLPTLVANPCNNFGPRQHPEKLIPKMILAAAAGEELPLYGDGNYERQWIHVDDCCRAIRRVLAIAPPDSRYVIGAEHCASNLSVVQLICEMVDAALSDGGRRSKLIRRVADRPGHDRRYALDWARVGSETGWQPQISFLEGLRATVAWYLQNDVWTKAVTAPQRGTS